MTSMSAVGSIASGRSMMDARIASAVKSGSISSTDQSAFSKVLDSIDSSLSSSGTAGAPPKGMKEKIDSIIQDQVSSGALTSDQASELTSFFTPPSRGNGQSGEGGDSQMGVGGPGGPGGPTGAGGPPPPPPSGDSGDSDSESSDSSDTSSLDAQLEALEKMLGNLRETLGNTLGYGTTSSSSSVAGLIVNTTA